MFVTEQRPGRVLLVEEVGLGGITDYTNELAQALAQAGWAVHLATGRDHDAAAMTNVTVHRVFPYLRRQSWFGKLAHRLRLARLINGATHLGAYLLVARLARRCDIAHVQGEEWPPLAATLMLLLRSSGRAVIYTPHNTFDRGERSYPRAHWLIRRCATKIVVHSEYDRRVLSASQVRKAVVIAHGEYGGLARRGEPQRDPESLRAEFGLNTEEPVVLLFGQLRRDKGVRDLLAAAAEVEGIQVVLAGANNGALDEATDLLEDPRLRGRTLVMEGFMPIERVGELFGAVDVVVLPYPKASASGVLLLAYGYGRPVLCYPVGGLPEYVRDGQTGWLCERADRTALAQGLLMIRTAGRKECRARGEAAKRFSRERFGWDVIARQTITLYQEARHEQP